MRKKRILALITAMTIATTSITGCGIQIGGITIGNVDDEEKEDDSNNTKTTELGDSQASETTSTVDTDKISANTTQSLGEFNTLSYITSFQSLSSTVEGQYNSPMYDLPEDYAFEFNYTPVPDANPVQYFKVFSEDAFNAIMNDDSLSFKDSSAYTAWSSSGDEYGTLIIKPNGSFLATTTDHTESKDTWGSYGKLYLVQLKDLTTGEDLNEPIITPFSTVHKLSAPVISQSVVDGYYTLSWDAVPGATSYSVYYTYTGSSGYAGYSFEASTTNTTISTKDFYWDKQDDSLQQALSNDIKNMGSVSDTDGKYWINYSVEMLMDKKNVSFIVVALDSAGNTSGFSNKADVMSIASSIPYKVSNTSIEANIESILDTPTYADIEMVDGSISQMVINYHGAQTYVSEDRQTTTIVAKVYNTPFATLSVKITGMDYDTFMSQVDQVTARQDALVGTASANQTTVAIGSVPSNEETNDDKKVKEDIATAEIETTSTEPAPSTETTEVQTPVTTPVETPTVDNPSTDGLVYTPEGFTTYDLFLYAVSVVQDRIQQMPEVVNTMYATSDLEAWIALCLVSNLPTIPVPTCVFPEAANTDYLMQLSLEAYMQNPTCGVAEGIGYSYDYESLTVYWDEDFEINMYKQIAEVNAAKQAAQSIEATVSTDIDKIVAINNYLCEIGTYDTASAEADESVITEAVINAHTPYGILINHLGVCESYAESFTLIARYLGFDCLNEAGTIYGGPHEWVRVKIGNNWYVVDPTNNDLELADNALLAISDEQKSGTLVAYDGYAYFGSYPATDDSLEYYTRNGSTATSTEDAYNKLVEQLNTSSTAAIRLPNGSTEDQAIEIIQRIIKQANIQLTNAMYICDVVAVTK